MTKTSSIVSVLLPLLVHVASISATPFLRDGPQLPFGLSEHLSRLAQSSTTDNRPASLKAALGSLHDASGKVVKTFEDVMAEIPEVSSRLTWELPQKSANKRLDWDFTVSSEALPEHALRVKDPQELGVDDVKQVCFPYGIANY
jgi:hypothetical protein